MRRIGENIIVSISLLLLGFSTIAAQTDSLILSDDSTSTSVEQLIEQSTQLDDDSPLLDLLFPESYFHRDRIEFRSRISQSLQRSAGYSDGVYGGSPMKSYQRIKFARGGHLSGGALIEKDAGEERLNDFITGNVTIADFSPVSKLVLGDYIVEAGQGTALWRSYEVSKGAEVIAPVKRKAGGIRPYVSSGENGFLRGGAAAFRFGPIVPTFFYSDVARSATLDSNQSVTSFYTSGYFRTESERAKRDNARERFFGGRVDFEFSETNNLGVSMTSTTYSHPLLIEGGREFSGDRNSMYSLDYAFSNPPMSFFGEWATSNSVVGGISGVDIATNNTVEIVAAFRSYPSGFLNLHGNGFGERGSNEKGMYVGMKLRPMNHVRVSCYYDQFSFTDRTSSIFPSDGNDALVQVEILPVSRLEVTARYQRKAKIAQETIVTNSGLSQTVEDYQRKETIRLDADYRLSREVQLRGRIEHTIITPVAADGRETGTAFYQDLRYTPDTRLSFDFRVIFFRTDSYASGIYEYERDLEGVLTMPVLYGRGTRWYFLAKYEPTEMLSILMKYSDHIRDDVHRIGTGYDELPTNHDNRVGVQVDWRWE